MSDLAPDAVTFLRARLDEDEASARAAEHADGPETLHWHPGGTRHLRFDNGCGESYSAVFCGQWDRILIARDNVRRGPLAEHIARWDPARVLAEVAAKRDLIAQLLATNEGDGRTEAALRTLAQPYSGHPGFPAEWSES